MQAKSFTFRQITRVRYFFITPAISCHNCNPQHIHICREPLRNSKGRLKTNHTLTVVEGVDKPRTQLPVSLRFCTGRIKRRPQQLALNG